MSVYDTLLERGFIEQTTHEKELRELLENEKVTFYTGFDPTADSLTAGHYMTLMAMAHMQRAGHRPIVLVGGGTGMVGDPTDRTEMRRLMSPEEVRHNVECFQKQMERFIDFSGGKALLLNNADWLLALKYVDFIREYGVHFSVNKMLTADAYRSRFEKGLSFFEFNYMLMQAYDFLELYRRHDCRLQMGGNDQWSNIIAGADLIRRAEDGSAYGLTLTILATSDGKKMGKSQKGAVWLDADKTTPFEFFQYWRNVDDADVGKFLGLLTFLPMEDVRRLSAVEGQALNHAKEVLAFEVTKTVHGEAEAEKALQAAKALFGGGAPEGSVPTVSLAKAELGAGLNIIELLEKAAFIPSRGEGRRLIQQGGVKLNDQKVDAFDLVVTEKDFIDGRLMLQKGKKGYCRVELV